MVWFGGGGNWLSSDFTMCGLGQLLTLFCFHYFSFFCNSYYDLEKKFCPHSKTKSVSGPVAQDPNPIYDRSQNLLLHNLSQLLYSTISVTNRSNHVCH